MDLYPYAPVPHFLTWPVPLPGEFDYAYKLGGSPMEPWQASRCAMCGALGSLVLDHDHDTGFTRGYLCRGCNFAESTGYRHAAFELWSAGLNPARIFGWEDEYVPAVADFSGPAVGNKAKAQAVEAASALHPEAS